MAMLKKIEFGGLKELARLKRMKEAVLQEY